MASAEKIIEDALELDEHDRARVVDVLLRSLGPVEDEGVIDSWTSELGRRLREVEDGSVELIRLDEVKRRMALRRTARNKTP